jgi:hypothetical protein
MTGKMGMRPPREFMDLTFGSVLGGCFRVGMPLEGVSWVFNTTRYYPNIS